MGCMHPTNRNKSSICGKTRRISGLELLKSNYKISPQSKILGAGSFGKVFLSESVLDPNFKVAVKVVNKHKLRDALDQIKEEISILSKLDHPNIVKYYETYDDPKYMYIVMEYCNGGELLDRLTFQEKKSFTEFEAA